MYVANAKQSERWIRCRNCVHLRPSSSLPYGAWLSDYNVIEVEDRLFDSPIAPNRETRCRTPQNVVLTREETLKLVNSLDGAVSKVSESPSCFSRCLRRQVQVNGHRSGFRFQWRFSKP
jgi:hypothetical protein